MAHKRAKYRAKNVSARSLDGIQPERLADGRIIFHVTDRPYLLTIGDFSGRFSSIQAARLAARQYSLAARLDRPTSIESLEPLRYAIEYGIGKEYRKLVERTSIKERAHVGFGVKYDGDTAPMPEGIKEMVVRTAKGSRKIVRVSTARKRRIPGNGQHPLLSDYDRKVRQLSDNARAHAFDTLDKRQNLIDLAATIIVSHIFSIDISGNYNSCGDDRQLSLFE
jgi:hypothetical protein